MSLLNTFYNREGSFSQEYKKLLNQIEAFAEAPQLQPFYQHFETHYDLPAKIVRRRLMQSVADQLDLTSTHPFQKRFTPDPFKEAACKHSARLLLQLLRASRRTEALVMRPRLVIETIEFEGEYQRFLPLIQKFEPGEVVVVKSEDVPTDEVSCYRQPRREKLPYKLVSRVLSVELLHGLKLYYRLCQILQFNLIPVVRNIIEEYLYYQHVFSVVQARVLLQDRHYQTSAIKNHLFHQAGGRQVCVMQKNIIQQGHNGSFYDCDTLFTLGNETGQRAFELGARIDRLVPVGSMYMDSLWFEEFRYQNQAEGVETFDVVCIGFNTGKFQHAYQSYENDYYEHFRWLVRLSELKSEWKIRICHHTNYRDDPRELEIIQGSRVEHAPHHLNSYALASQARLVVTFGSTMGYELIGHGKPVLFLDPGRRNTQYLPDDDLIDTWRVTDFEAFVRATEKWMDQTCPPDERLCRNSANASKRIFDAIRAIS